MQRPREERLTGIVSCCTAHSLGRPCGTAEGSVERNDAGIKQSAESRDRIKTWAVSKELGGWMKTLLFRQVGGVESGRIRVFWGGVGGGCL